MTRAERRAMDARITALEQERDTLIGLLDWYAASRLRWMAAVESGDRRIYAMTGGRLHGPDEDLPAPIGCVNRPDLRPVERPERSEAAIDLDYYADDINRW